MTIEGKIPLIKENTDRLDVIWSTKEDMSSAIKTVEDNVQLTNRNQSLDNMFPLHGTSPNLQVNGVHKIPTY